jgi:acyl-CoA oxidase
MADIKAAGGHHRDETFNSQILPRCRSIVQATGQRMAYEASQSSSKITQQMLRLYETTCILEGASWYVEHQVASREEIYKNHAKAVRELLPSLEVLLENTGAEPWATAPILSQGRWNEFVEQLPLFCSTKSTKAISFVRFNVLGVLAREFGLALRCWIRAATGWVTGKAFVT